MALVVNPQQHRSQNQLHVHMLRLAVDARKRLEAEEPAYVTDLQTVWRVAANSAANKGLNDYGVIVVKRDTADYMVVVTAGSPEDEFTKWRCD